ncbi:MAG: AAA family ATPase [Candidatus Rokuibacteriota bacterium]|nr:MAG: AAA family ATPase [Candidatus Rokubacteria bacterium]
MTQSPEPVPTQEQRVQDFIAAFQSLRAEVSKIIVGHDDVIEHVLIALFAGGHALLEGVPGLGKTLLIKTLAECLDLTFSRIQFTPDLMPGDIIGTNIIVEDPSGRKQFQFQRGPIFGHILLADEINRATPKTQSALLEGMQEGSVTVSGTSNLLPSPFFVLATQNPIEMEGTYPLPEAQLDRFLFKLRVKYPALSELAEIIDRTTHVYDMAVRRVMSGEHVLSCRELVREVPIAAHVRDLASLIVLSTHPQWEHTPDSARRFIRYGASPRGAQALVLGAKVRALSAGRYNVSVDDLRAMALPALRHRLILNFEGEAEGVDVDRLIGELVEAAESMSVSGKEVFLR